MRLSTPKLFFGLKTTERDVNKDICFFLEYWSMKKANNDGNNKTSEITAPI
jgi:hypothetical protein